MTKTTTTYAIPPEPDGPVWDEGGRKWEREGGLWKTGSYRDCEWMWGDLLYIRGPLTEPGPTPAWPTAPLVWQDGKVWERDEAGDYDSVNDMWGKRHMNSETADIRDGARRFAREAIPVTIVPTREWERLRRCVEDVEDEGVVWDAAEALVDATEALNGETNE